ncbi:hypothetical protein LEP3755_29040 [Leptolyngbya sp. NIES-3755]|nr:hypothetical protein LEP3755_29040 [Leptolyngbya sp. NIES-3755]
MSENIMHNEALELSSEELETVAGGAIRKRTNARFSSNVEEVSDFVSAGPGGTIVSSDAFNEEIDTDGGSETIVE